MQNILNNIPDKTTYKNTTSLEFKSDLIDFFETKQLDTCLEIGTNHGHTTYVLANIFGQVYTVDHDPSNTSKAKAFNSKLSNIEYITGNAYASKTYVNVPKLDVAFIDCMHTYDGVLADIQTALSLCRDTGMYLIFDDYGHPTSTGVYAAIEEAITQGLTREVYIGQQEGYTYSKSISPTTLIRREGIILSYGK